MVILVDSREQRKLDFAEETRVEALPVGDYWCEFSDGSRPPIIFERKSLADLFGTMTNGYPRFKNEMLAASNAGWKLVLIVEASLTDVYGGYGHSAFSGDSCVRKLFTLWLKYGLAPVFCQSRKESAEFIAETFHAAGRCWKLKGQPARELFGGMQIPLVPTELD